MKLPFTLGIRLIYRLLLPGFILSLGFLPIYLSLFPQMPEPLDLPWVLLLSTLLLGWVVNTLEMQIYMFAEGRRYWPTRMKYWFLRRQARRLKKLQELEKKAMRDRAHHVTRLEEVDAELQVCNCKDERRRLQELKERIEAERITAESLYREVGVDLRQFPVDEEFVEVVQSPTRLGNLISSYEQYPNRAYGADGIFFWYRLNLEMPSDQREEFDEQQAAIDGTVYASICFLVVGIVNLLFFLRSLMLGLSERIEAATHSIVEPVAFDFSVSACNFLIIGAISLAVSFVIYGISLPLHATFGDHFKAIVDKYLPKVNLDLALDQVIADTNETDLAQWSKRKKYKVAWRYLHNYRVRGADEKTSRRPKSLEE